MKFVQEHMPLFMIAVVSGLTFLWLTLSRRLLGGRQVSTLEAVQMMNRRDAVLVDVREAGEFKGGRIANSRNIPLKELGGRLGELEKLKSKPVLLVCQSGQRSGQALATLKKAGFTEVASLAGGLHAWQQAGMPVDKG